MTEAENFSRLVRLLAKGGTRCMRTLLNKYSKPLEFMDYLYNNQNLLPKLKLSDDQLKLLASREIDKMDITLLYKLTLNIFKDKMTADEKTNLTKIKKERDSFLHSNILESAKADDQFFSQKWRYISTLLTDTAGALGCVDLQSEIKIIIETTKQCSPDFSETYKILIGWCESKGELTEKVEENCAGLNELSTKLKETEKKLFTRQDSLIDKFKSHYDYNTKVDIQLTEKMKAALNYLEDSFSVVLFGRPGEGKTAAAFRLVQSLIGDKQISLNRCALLFEPDDLKDVRSKDVDLVLIDDMYGKHNTEADKVSRWRSFLPTLQAFAGNREVRIIVTSRKHIYLECKRELNGIEAFERTVELNSQELSVHEKRLILISQLKYYDKKVDDKDIEVCISQQESDVGFPLCSQQFSQSN